MPQVIYESRDHGEHIDATEKTYPCGHGRDGSDRKASRRVPARARKRGSGDRAEREGSEGPGGAQCGALHREFHDVEGLATPSRVWTGVFATVSLGALGIGITVQIGVRANPL